MTRANTTQRFAFYVLPTIWRTCLAFAVLPLTTYRLGPEDFGLLALVVSISSLGAGASGLGAAYPLAKYLPELDRAGRRQLVSTLLWLGLLAGAFISLVVWVAWQPLVALIPEMSKISTEARWIVCALILLGVPWNHAVATITVTGQARTFAATTIAESTATASATLIALYVFNLGGQSLLIGALAGGATNAIGSVIALRHYLTFRLGTYWLTESLHVGGFAIVGSLVERGQVVVERYALARFVGIGELGIYSQSQQYFSLAREGAKAVNNAVWPVALDEARAGTKTFSVLRQVWSLAHIALALAGVFMATVGQDAIALLTHGKFTQAHVLATFWILLVLISNTARSAAAIVYAFGEGPANQRISLFSTCLAIAATVPGVIWLGAYGAILANFIAVVVYRVLVTRYARRLASFSSDDKTVVPGVAVVLASLAAMSFSPPTVYAHLLICAVFAALLIAHCRADWRPVLNSLAFRFQTVR